MQKINTHHISYILFVILGLLLVASNNLVLIMFGAALIALTIGRRTIRYAVRAAFCLRL